MSLERLSETYSVITWILVGALLIVFIIRLVNLFRKRSTRKPMLAERSWRFPIVLKLLWGVTVLLTLFYALPFGVVASAVRPLISETANNSLLIITVMICLVELFLLKSISQSLLKEVPKKVILSLLITALLPLALYFSIYVPDIFTYPESELCYTLDLPTKGNWKAGHAGGSEIVNYHCAYPDQVFAVDVSKEGTNGKIYENSGELVSDFFTFGDSIYAPVSGVIVYKVDSLENAGVSMFPNDTLNPAGNHLVIEFEANRFLFLAHLSKHSIQVNLGDSARTGQYLAKAGNSGNTSWPHLHMHIQDLPHIDFKRAKGYPFRFRAMERNRWYYWETVANDYLLRNDRFRPAAQ